MKRAAKASGAWWVYILRCADRTLYTGVTTDVERRAGAHNTGRGARYTRARLPVRVVYVESAESRGAALRREIAIKAMTRSEKLRLVRAKRDESRRPIPSAEA